MNFFKILFLFLSLYSFSQSTSVFDANYFNNDNFSPPLKEGKGFHINDVYRQTRNCFRLETIDSKKLIAQQQGVKTSLKLYYTKSNKDFTEFRSRGTSGKVTYLNLFAFDGNKLDEFTKTSSVEEERLIFSAVVDFGNFEFLKEPILNDEAKKLISEKKLKEFVNFYGTHYISGVRRASSIIIILKKNKTETSSKYSQQNQMNTNGKIPYKSRGSLEVDNSDWINNELKSNNFSVSVEILGPSLQQTTLQSQINSILIGNGSDKLNSIIKIIEDVTSNITNPNQSLITQYYYSPFSLYGLEGIYWDSKKQNDLIKLNEMLISLHNDKVSIENLLNGDNFFAGFNSEGNSIAESNKQKVISNFKSYKSEIEFLEKSIEQKYNSCSDVFCSSSDLDCCNVNVFLNEIKDRNYSDKIQNSLTDFFNEIKKIAENERECFKRQKGVVKIENISSNPYDFYIGKKYVGVINGKSSQLFYLSEGYFEFKAVQRTGFLLYPTENIRSVRIQNVCQEFVIKIGF